MLHRLPHGVSRRGRNEIVLLREIMLLRTARYTGPRGDAAGAETGISVLPLVQLSENKGLILP